MIQSFRKYSFLFLFVGLTFLGKAQSIEADLERIQQRYAEVEFLSFDLAGYVYATATAKGELNFKGSFKKRGEDFYTKAWDREMIVKGEAMVLVDHESHKIILGRSRPNSMEEMNLPNFSLDSLQTLGGDLQLLASQGSERHYQIQLPESLVAKIDLFVDDTDLIRRMVYHYRETKEAQPAYAKVEMRYQNLRLTPPADRFFNEQQFYQEATDGTLSAKAPYQKYTVQKVDYTAFSNQTF